jgi:hypothetical protein
MDQKSHFRLYTPKLGYKDMFGKERPENVQWSWKPMWNIGSPLKDKIFVCLTITNKTITYNVL